jgi:hypothetical protein
MGDGSAPVEKSQRPRMGLSAAVLLGSTSSIALLTPVGPAETRLALAILGAVCLGTLAAWLVLPAFDHGETWDGLDTAMLGACLAIIAILLIAGLVTALPGPITGQGLAVVSLLSCFALGAVAFRQRAHGRSIAASTFGHLALLVLVAGSLRLVDLGYSEFQGDEASILHRASAIVQDVNEAVLAHRKGPGEILVAAYFGQLVGRVTEADARFPFAIASVMSVLAIYAVGRAMFSPSAGLAAGLLWAINGYSVGFGRIVQYHSITVLVSLAALLCAWKGLLPGAPRRVLCFASIGLLGLCLVFAFNVITLGLPAVLAIGMTVLGSLGRVQLMLKPSRLGRREATWTALASVVLAAIGIYVTLEWRDMLRLLSLRLGQGQPFDNLDTFASVSVRYLGQPYLLLVVGVSLGVGVWLATRVWTSRWMGRLITLALAVMIGLLVAIPGAPTWLAIVVWVLLVLVCIMSTAERRWRVLGLAALLPMGLYGFLIRQTGTHWYEAFPWMALIVGASASAIVPRLPLHTRDAALATGGALLIFVGLYPMYTFLPMMRSDALPVATLYRPPWTAIREGGSFGFPHQDGLKAVALLENVGALPLPYDGNSTAEVTTWYMPTAERCERTQESYIIAFSERRPSEALPPRDGWLILVRDQPGTLVRVRDDWHYAFSRLAVEPASQWFDDNFARLQRPLSVARTYCNRTMRPFWQPN